MISGRDIIYISSVDWDFLWQGPQEIAARFARAGNRVFYIENTGIRAPNLRDTRRVARRLRNWTRAWRRRGVRQVAPNLYVCSPLVLPPFGPPWRQLVNRRLLLPLVARAARDLGLRDPLLWTYLPTDTSLELFHALRSPQSVAVYYFVDNFAVMTPHPEKLKRSEEALIKACDLIFATNGKLAERCAQWTEKVHVLPYGVNLDAFPLDSAAAAGRSLSGKVETSPNGKSKLGAPVIGYVGGLHRHVDFDLMLAMARARPDWAWVCVGAVQTSTGKLAKLPNVYLLGQRPHHELAELIRGFDVCIVPYVKNLYTETVVPTKINEYLAVGKPVVATAIPSVVEFNRKYEVLWLAENRSESFLQAIEQALELAPNKALAARRREVAAHGEWKPRLELMSCFISDKFEEKLAAAETG